MRISDCSSDVFSSDLLVAGEAGLALAALHGDGGDLRVEAPIRLRLREAALRPFGPAVLRIPRDLGSGDQILRMPARMPAGKGVVQSVAQHGIDDRRVPHAIDRKSTRLNSSH